MDYASYFAILKAKLAYKILDGDLFFHEGGAPKVYMQKCKATIIYSVNHRQTFILFRRTGMCYTSTVENVFTVDFIQFYSKDVR